MKHGQSLGNGTKLYCTWKRVKQRCLNPRNPKYPEYGGAGREMYLPWQEDFSLFAAELGDPPSPAHTVERKDNSKGYVPGNIKWATKSEQARNTKRNVMITIGDTTLCMTAWCELTGVCELLAAARINRLGWDRERAVTQPARPDKRTPR